MFLLEAHAEKGIRYKKTPNDEWIVVHRGRISNEALFKQLIQQTVLSAESPQHAIAANQSDKSHYNHF